MAKFDQENNNLNVVQSVEFNGLYFALFDQFNPSRFILKRCGRGEIRVCKVINGQIQVSEAIEIEWNVDDKTLSYFDDKLFGLRLNWTNDGKIVGVNLKLKFHI